MKRTFFLSVHTFAHGGAGIAFQVFHDGAARVRCGGLVIAFAAGGDEEYKEGPEKFHIGLV